MPVSVLIPPDHRLLGSALSDLTLYGTQPTADMTIGRAPDGGSALQPAAFSTSASTTPPAMSESEHAAGETTALLDRDDIQAPQPSSAPLAAPVDHTASPVADAQPSAPQPIGSGSFLQAPVATAPQSTSADHGGTADGVGQPLASLGGALPDSLSHTADAVLGGHGLTLDPAGTIGTVVADLGTAELFPPGADIAGLPGMALDAAPLSAFGGSDPAAGLQTLIGMVDSGEAFDLDHLTSSGHDTTGSGSILDSLAADEAPSSLLGDESDGGHHALDDHGIHLGA